MRKGHIAAVEFLAVGPDEALIEQAKAHCLSGRGEVTGNDGDGRPHGQPRLEVRLYQRPLSNSLARFKM
jgi:hypothetical protein